jgi:hypothetical protein
VNHLHDEMLHARASGKEDPYLQSASLHLRLTPEQANVYHQRLRSLIDEMILEAPESSGQVYSIFITMFTSPDYLQVEQPVTDAETQTDDGGDPCNQ